MTTVPSTSGTLSKLIITTHIFEGYLLTQMNINMMSGIESAWQKPCCKEVLFSTMLCMTAWAASIACATGGKKRRKRHPGTQFHDSCSLIDLLSHDDITVIVVSWWHHDWAQNTKLLTRMTSYIVQNNACTNHSDIIRVKPVPCVKKTEAVTDRRAARFYPSQAPQLTPGLSVDEMLQFLNGPTPWKVKQGSLPMLHRILLITKQM